MKVRPSQLELVFRIKHSRKNSQFVVCAFHLLSRANHTQCMLMKGYTHIEWSLERNMLMVNSPKKTPSSIHFAQRSNLNSRGSPIVSETMQQISGSENSGFLRCSYAYGGTVASEIPTWYKCLALRKLSKVHRFWKGDLSHKDSVLCSE